MKRIARHILHEAGLRGGSSLLGGIAALAGAIIESETADKQAQLASEREMAAKNEFWVICDTCGKRFDFNKTGGLYHPEEKRYTCSVCINGVNRSMTWVCKNCGATTKGLQCEYCDSPRDGQATTLVTWKCGACGKINTGNFCARCGKRH